MKYTLINICNRPYIIIDYKYIITTYMDHTVTFNAGHSQLGNGGADTIHCEIYTINIYK